MKRRFLPKGIFIVLPLLTAALLLGHALVVYSNEQGVKAIIEAAEAPVDHATSVERAIPLPSDVVQVKVKHLGNAFWTQTRKDKVERFQCSQCHNNQTVSANSAEAIAHGDIVLDHGGSQRPLDCMTCHKSDDRNAFETEKGVTVDMDHIYELCGQCHFRQEKDWIGGAHGKRIGTWAGQRVVANCTSCHDPHSPRFKKRWPRTYSLPLD